MEKLARAKHSSLYKRSYITAIKSFITFGPGVTAKPFFFVTDIPDKQAVVCTIKNITFIMMIVKVMPQWNSALSKM